MNWKDEFVVYFVGELASQHKFTTHVFLFELRSPGNIHSRWPIDTTKWPTKFKGTNWGKTDVKFEAKVYTTEY